MSRSRKAPKAKRGRSSAVESLPSKQTVAGSIPAARYNLWNPPPYEERKKALDEFWKGVKIDPKVKVSKKKLQAAIEASEKEFARFKPRQLTDLEWATMMLRPIF